MPITIYENAKFVPTDPNWKLANLSSVAFRNECVCQCLANSRCFTATFVGIDQTCTLFSVQLNRDWLQLVVTNMQSSVLSLENKTVLVASFKEMNAATPLPIANYSYLNAIAMDDLNGDSMIDITAVYRNTLNLVVWLGYGNGTFAGGGIFAIKQAAVSTGSGSLPFQMVLGYSNRTQFVLVSNTSYPFNYNGPFPISAVATDFNQDSLLDVAVVTQSGTVVVFSGDGNGRLNSPLAYTTGDSTGWVSSIVAFDANGDGNKDLAVTNAGGHSVAVLFGDGQGHFSSPTLYLTSGPPSVMLVTDANQDGYSDILLLNGSTCYTLLLGSTDGTFVTSISCGTISIGYATGLAIGDINNDGIADIVIGATGTIDILIFLGSIN